MHNGGVDRDINNIKKAVEEELLGAYLSGGYGAALVEMSDLENMSDVELVRYANRLGIDTSEYGY